MSVRVVVVCAVASLLFGVSVASAQRDQRDPESQTSPGPESTETEGEATPEQKVDIDELERRIELLAEEVERLRSGEDTDATELTPEEVRALGLAPSAAATYARGSGVSIAGYGEMLYEDFASENQKGDPSGDGARLDFLRAIIYAGYRFNDTFLFNSEIEIEHADEISVEFAYLDYLVHENLGLRGGMVLLPMGLVNEFHEPTVFLGAERPVTEQRIIPTTWRENGGGIHGSGDRVSYRAYFVNGLDGQRFSADGVRGGRQKGSETKAGNMAFAGRLDFTPTPGIFVGGSLYAGGSGQGDIVIDGTSYDVQTTIVDLHGQAQFRGFDVRGLYARSHIDDAAPLNQVLGLDGADGIAEVMRGGYAQLGYNVLSQVASAGGVALTPYLRWERVDTQATMPTGFDRSLATDNTFTTIGVDVKPIPNIVLKADYTWVSNDADTGVNQFNVNLGYAF